jgi:dipeptidase
MKRVVSFVLIVFAAAFYLLSQEDNCFTVIAGKQATDTGSVIIAHNEDDRGFLFVNVHKIPPASHHDNETVKLRHNGSIHQVPFTFGFLWLQIPGVEFGDSYFNDKGVVITSNSCPSREDRGELTNGGIGFMLRRIIAARAASAREAVKIAGSFIEKFGYYSSGRTLCIADANEGWILHIVKGKHWIAQRVPDHQVAVIANRYTVNAANVADKKNLMMSPGLIQYAVERGWYREDNRGTDKPFPFASVYANPESYNSQANILREWRGIQLLAKKKHKIDAPFPFSFIPRKKIDIEDLFKVLRDHYEDTEYDLTDDYKNGSPNATKNRTICTRSTKYSFVAELRADLPNEIRDIIWIAMMRPDSSAYSPWYTSMISPPAGYSRGNPDTALGTHFNKTKENYNLNYAYWCFARLSELVDQDYRNRIKPVRKEWNNYENYVMKSIRKKEKEFKYLLNRNRNIASKILTNYIHNLEFRKWFLASELVKEFKN